MTVATVDQSDLQCPACAGQRVFDPAQAGLVCESCGAAESLETSEPHDAAREIPYDPEQPPDEPHTQRDGHMHQCETCGGQVVFTGRALSDRCPYCDGPVVLGGPDSAYAALALIPFRLPGGDATGNAHRWVARRIAAPGDLAGVVAKARVAGLYAPFWTFDCSDAVRYWAKYTTGSGDNRRTRSTTGAMTIEFDDLLMPASPHVTPLIRDGILHDFDPRRLRPWRTGYLAGFAAERHHQTVQQGLEANQPDKRLLIRNRIKRHINRSRVHSIWFETDTTGIRYRRILMPVWMLHYRYGGKAYKVVVSGIDGRTFGERPFSRWKLAGYSALATGAAMLIGLAWGAAGVL